MIYDYVGHFPYSGLSVTLNAIDSLGVYYCGYVNTQGELVPSYIGRAVGDDVSIRSRLRDHLRDDYWPNVTHFGYRVCTTQTEAKDLEATEIRRFQPSYNTQGIH
jgi:excinuclease UvrABC nuclease subunit